jgi:NADPH:quinone reductase
MDALYLTGPGEDKLEYGKLEIPTPGKGQVLIKVESCPINPSDMYFMEGKYGSLMDFKYPMTPGWEGSGTVFHTGGGLHAWYLQGKRVAFSKCNEDMEEGSQMKIGGTMAQYAVTNAYQ